MKLKKVIKKSGTQNNQAPYIRVGPNVLNVSRFAAKHVGITDKAGLEINMNEDTYQFVICFSDPAIEDKYTIPLRLADATDPKFPAYQCSIPKKLRQDGLEVGKYYLGEGVVQEEKLWFKLIKAK